MNGNGGRHEQAIQFVRDLFQLYLEKRDFARMISLLHQDVTWFGTGAFEVCRSHQEAIALLEAERSSWDGNFKILAQWYDAIPVSNQSWIVYGELKIIEDGLSTILLDMYSRFSMICTMEEGTFKLLHAHFSVPNAAQEQNEFVHKNLIKNYNLLLEEKLQERTKMLKDKTTELEALMNNIFGGVQICRLDEDFTILYTNDGFTALTGYTQEDIAACLGGKHMLLVYPQDTLILTRDIINQLQADGCFSVEYRILRKDGQIVWVISKGSFLPGEKGERNIQCILTDITRQKKQEEALRISEKRYEVAMQLSEITMFEYNLLTKELLLFEDDTKMFNVPAVIQNGTDVLINRGIVEPGSVADYREMYRKIHAGAPFAKCQINSRDANGMVHDFELSLTSVFDNSGNPIRAIGVRKNVSQMRRLQMEQEFGKAMVTGKIFGCEADVTNDVVLYVHKPWASYLGASENMRFSALIDQLIKSGVAPEYREFVAGKLSGSYIAEQFEHGQRVVSFSYKRKNSKDTYVWYEATVHIIKDPREGALNIRFYYMDIHQRKVKEERALEEQCLYESMVAKAMLAYEVNITRNLAIKGHEKWIDLYRIEKSDDYDQMITMFSQKGVHVEDGAAFAALFSRANVLQAFQNGERQIACQYRKPSLEGEYKWVNCTLHLYEDPGTNDVKGFSYVEDIDEQKRAELALRYKAAHDALTGLYNKEATETRIAEFLRVAEGQDLQHAFIMIDIDYFKCINDTFGHLFGDAVLERISGKIRSVFREQDIVGRIGGDEFCVLMKNVHAAEAVKMKADELCAKLLQTYTEGDKSCTISASIGIALYNAHGSSYEKLYNHADIALYVAKKRGKNQYAIYLGAEEINKSGMVLY